MEAMRLSVTNLFFVRKQTEIGSSNVQAIGIETSVLFVTRDGRRVRDFKFNRDNGSFISTNLSIINDSIVFAGFDGATGSTLKGVTFLEMHYQLSRDTIWLLTSNNALVGLTLAKDSGVVAWHRHNIRTGDVIRGISVIPSTSGNFDELWMVVERSIDSSTTFYVEKMGDDFEHTFLDNSSSSDDDTPYYSDAGIKIVLGSTTDTVTLPNNAVNDTASHLEGETVKVLAAGLVEVDKTVSGGQITLVAALPSGTPIVLGLPYIAKMRTLDIEAGADFGSAQGVIQRIDRVDIRLYKSQKGKFSTTISANSDEIEYENGTIFTGNKKQYVPASPDENMQFEIEHDDPVPFNLLSMTFRGVSFD